jgi:hypothetical protein
MQIYFVFLYHKTCKKKNKDRRRLSWDRLEMEPAIGKVNLGQN